MKDIIIVGGSGFGKEVIWLARDCGRNIKGVLDDSKEIGETFFNHNVLGGVSDWIEHEECEFIVAIGSPRVRKEVVSKMLSLGKPSYGKLIHPSVSLSESVQVGEGTVVCAGCVTTVDIKIGNHNIININSTIGHDCVLGDYVTVAPVVAISGNVRLDNFVEVGTGASIRQGLSLEEGAMLGMGGVLTKNIPVNTVFAGNPAKKLKEL